MTIDDSLTNNISCYGFNDGQIGLNVTGGFEPYQFKVFDQIIETNLITNLSAGNYIIEVLDGIGCADTISIFLNQPEAPLNIINYELSDSLDYCVLCHGDTNGYINITVNGGTQDYLYHNISDLNTFTTSNITNLVGGNEYQFYVSDANGCVSDTFIFVCSSPDELDVEIENFSLPSCCYSCDSELSILATGGISPYSFSIDNLIFQNDALFTQLCGDSNYVFTIVDNYGCEKQHTVNELNNLPCLVIDSINYFNSNSPALVNYDICQQDGTAKIYVTAFNGTGNYSFSIDGNSFVEQEQILFDSLSQGSHYIIVNDELNCSDTLSFIVDEPNPIFISDLTIDTIYCGAPSINSNTNQSDLGAINVIASGGTSGVYFYSLDQIDSLLYQSNGLFENLDSGYYSLNIIDANDCTQEFDLYVPHYSSSLDYDLGNITCPGFNDGFIQVNSFINDFGSWLTLNGNISDDNSFFQLSPGNYELSVNYFIPNSSEICTYSDSILLFDQNPLDFTYDVSNPSCYDNCDGSINISQSQGGTPPYTLICLNTLDSGLVFDNLCDGEYAIKLVDSNGCFLIQDIVMVEPNAIYPIIDFENGQLMVVEPTLTNPVSGIPPYTYQWYGEYGEIIGENDSIFEPNFSGIYSLLVTDNKGCKGQSSPYDIEITDIFYLTNKLVNIYPNPFNNILNIYTKNNEKVFWQISDVRGRIVDSGYDSFFWQINTSELLYGNYYLKLNMNNNEIIYKLIKH